MKVDQRYIDELLRQISKDDQKAFGSLFQLFYKRLLNFAYHYVRTHEVAEEIVSDVFVKLWDKRREISKIEKIDAYLFVSVKHAALNYLEKFSLYHVCAIPDEVRSELINQDNPQKELEWKELQFKVEEAVASLPDECQRVFRLSKEEGFKTKEVAEILELSPRTVENQLYKAVRKIDALLSDYMKRSFISKIKMF